MDFTDILNEFHIPYVREGEHEHAREGWINLDCPWCTNNHNYYRMGYNLRQGYVNCWACGHHNLVHTLMELTEQPYGVCLKMIRGLPKTFTPKEEPVRGKLELPMTLGPMKKVHRDYLSKRGINPDQVEKDWGVQGTTYDPQLPWRIFIPITLRGETVSWTTRKIVDEGMRYRSAAFNQEVFPHKEILYGEDKCNHSIIVVEGPVDVWKIGFGAVATLGSAHSRRQVQRMTKFSKRIICYDSEPSAQTAAKKLLTLLTPFPGDTYNVVLDSKDPGCATEKEIQTLRKMIGG